ncbi:MAG: helix-turn-helix domain-containing protein [Bacillota bacterium]
MIEKQKAELYKLDEVAEYLRISRRTLFSYIKSGKIAAFKLGSEWRISKDNLEKFLENIIKGIKN